jgi:hypothetical protein
MVRRISSCSKYLDVCMIKVLNTRSLRSMRYYGKCPAPVLDANVSKPIHAFYSYFFIVFSFKKIIRGHCPSVVTSGGNVTHKHFHGNEKVGS